MGLLDAAAELGPRRVRRLVGLAVAAVSMVVGLVFFSAGGGKVSTGHAPPLVGGAISSLCAERQAVAEAGGTPAASTSTLLPSSNLSGLGPGIASELRGLSCGTGVSTTTGTSAGQP